MAISAAMLDLTRTVKHVESIAILRPMKPPDDGIAGKSPSKSPLLDSLLLPGSGQRVCAHSHSCDSFIKSVINYSFKIRKKNNMIFRLGDEKVLTNWFSP